MLKKQNIFFLHHKCTIHKRFLPQSSLSVRTNSIKRIPIFNGLFPLSFLAIWSLKIRRTWWQRKRRLLGGSIWYWIESNSDVSHRLVSWAFGTSLRRAWPWRGRSGRASWCSERRSFEQHISHSPSLIWTRSSSLWSPSTTSACHEEIEDSSKGFGFWNLWVNG